MAKSSRAHGRHSSRGAATAKAGSRLARLLRQAEAEGLDAMDDGFKAAVVTEMKRGLAELDAAVDALRRETAHIRGEPVWPIVGELREFDRLMALIPGQSTMH